MSDAEGRKKWVIRLNSIACPLLLGCNVMLSNVISNFIPICEQEDFNKARYTANEQSLTDGAGAVIRVGRGGDVDGQGLCCG